MSDMAKKYREAMKGKARKLAGEKDQKVDSSDWSPAEPLNAEVKTGMRPISRRAYKSGGKVEGACAPKNLGRAQRKAGGKAESEKAEAAEYAKAKTNRDVKAANEEREGIKHIGGLKKGGRAKREDGGATNAQPSGGIRSRVRDFLKKVHPGDAAVQREQLRDVGSSQTSNIPAEDRERLNRLAGEAGMKKGGRAKKMAGGVLSGLATKNAFDAGNPFSTVGLVKGLMGKDDDKGKKNGGRAERKTGGKVATTLAQQEKIQRKQAAASKPTRGKAGHYADGGAADPRMTMVKPKAMEFSGAQGTPYKKGGKAGRMGKFYGGEVDGMGGDDRPETRFGGGRFGGMGGPGGFGKPAGMMGGMGNAPVGQQMPMTMGGGRGMGPSAFAGMGKPGGMMGGAMPAMPQQQMVGGGGLQQQMVGGMGKPAGMMGGMARKTGGRVARQDGGATKKAKSKAKGKTNINIVIATGQPDGQSMTPPPGGPPMPPPGVPVPLPAGGGAPPAPMGGMPMPAGPMPMPPMARKAGGRTMAKSYKDMTAGAGSGEGRMQKTEIAESRREPRKAGGKVYRSYKDMDAGAGSGLGRLEKSEIQSRKD